MKTVCAFVLGLTVLLFSSVPAWPEARAAGAPDNSECFGCHEDATLTTERDGKTVPLHVDPGAFGQSVHRGLRCVTCHADLVGAEIPHSSPLKPVDCGRCHTAAQKKFSDSLHGRALARGDKLAPRCGSCHGYHDILPLKDKNSKLAPLRIPHVCGSCHQEGAPVQLQREIHQDHILENYSESIHGEGLFKKGLSVSATCVSCHSSHQILPHTDRRSTIAQENIVETCEQCHTQIESVHRKVIKGEMWEKEPNRIPVCVECHQPHKARKVFYDQGVADKDCLMCHSKPEIKSADGRPMVVNEEHLKNSVHHRTSCAQCHNEVRPSLERACAAIKNRVNCAVCHSEHSEQYQQSTHGKLHNEGDANAPWCSDCHGTHATLGKKNVASPTFPTNVPQLCAKCHRENEKAAVRYKGKEHEIPEHYVESIHGKGLLKSGLVVTAMCTSCHTAHRALPAADPQSSVNPANIAVTCSGCHKGVYERYTRSIHAGGKTKDGKPLPVCHDCHSAHSIKRTDKDTFKFEIMDVCGKCHEKIAKTYFDTFHGKVSQLGYTKTAKCHDCHGSHDILPTSDPHSSLSRWNIVGTCQKCHPGATRRFAGYLTHATHHDPDKYPWVFWTFWSMTSLLVGVFLASGVHTLLWLLRSLITKHGLGHKEADPNAKQYVRFPLLYRILHGCMIVSFLTLAITGMSLKFSYSGWANAVSYVLGGFEVTGVLHRVAAVLLVAIFIVHLWDLYRRKRTEFGSWKNLILGPHTMLFTLRDVREIIGTLKWYLGRGERPRYGRWTYWEKFDYFAVFWGIAIIGLSGLMLWFPVIFTLVLPGWVINVATIVHSDEALLAAGFIFTVHFFNTHFRPDKFPMDPVIFTGRIPLEELKVDKPDEYEALMARGDIEQHLADPLPPKLVRTIKFFAWLALATGLAVVVGILYAMLFAYE